MRSKNLKYFLFLLVFRGFSFNAEAQVGLCPPNLDFEQGNFNNWICSIGTLDVNGNITWSPGISPVVDRHTIIATPGGTDVYGGFPELCPNGSSYSVKLGNVFSPPGRQVSRVSYTYTIPATLTTFSILFSYAIVLFDPPVNHTPIQRPRFKASITDLSTNQTIPCVDFDFISSASLPGFKPSLINPSVLYKDWTPVSINLSGLVGKTIRLEFTSYDCTQGGHFGYAYLDVNTNCNGVISGNTICPGDTAITLTAPYGFQSYEWYSDNTFTNLVSNTQTLYLHPPPLVGSIFPVIVTPYPSFGCKDTLYANINVGTKPVSDAGPDVPFCENQQVQIGAPSNPGYSYAWTPAAQVTNPSISNPKAWLLSPSPQEFIVKTTDILTGCFSYDTTVVTPGVNPPSNAGPDLIHCKGQPVLIGAPPTPGYSYLWTSAGQISNPNIANPTGLSYSFTPTEFIVKTTNTATGCFSYDTTLLAIQIVDTAISLNGKNDYCAGDPSSGILTVHNTVTAVQWYNGVTPIPGATGFTYQPATTGNYWAQVQQFGCTDSTATFTFNIHTVPASVAGPDASLCINQTKQIGAPPNPAYTYSWTPAAQVSDPAIADPVASVIGSTPVEFIVHTTDPTSGCNSYDTTIITGLVPDTALTLVGKTDYCNGDPAAGTLSVHNVVSAVQWYDGVNPIAGANGFIYQPVTTGNYWAQIQQFGCTDSTLIVPFNKHALPVPAFTASSDSGCLTNQSFVFTNGSGVTDGSSLSYLWKFSDGTTQTITDAVKKFLAAGDYNVKLIATSSFGCVDSTVNKTVHVLPNGVPDFKWDSICVNRPTFFYNLSNEKNSALVKYSWDFGSSTVPGSVLKNPPSVLYDTAGKINVVLKLVALGCENDTQTLVKTVQVNKQAPGIRYPDITVAQGYSKYMHARDSIGSIFNWRPTTQLSSYSTRYTEFFATNNDIEYKIDISDIHTCVTIDTVQMLILRKPGYYLPTAFTPNGDGLNDVVRPYLVGMKSLKSFSVFNRWGNLIYYTTIPGEGWDGKSKGITQDPGVYIWILEFIDASDKKVTAKGTLTLIR